VYLISSMLLEVPNNAANVHDAKHKIISMNIRCFLEISDKKKSTVFQKMLSIMSWLSQGFLSMETSTKLLTILHLDVLKFVKNRDSVLEMLKEKKIKEETLRTYLFTSSSSYDSLRVDQLANCFDLSSTCVHSIVSISVMNDVLHASWDQPSGCNHYKKTLKFRGTKLLGNNPYLHGMSIFSKELMSWKNSWLQSYYRGNFRGTFVFEEKRPATKVTSISEELCLRNVFNFLKKL